MTTRTMTALPLSDAILNDYVATFLQLEPQGRAILLDKLMESAQDNPLVPKRRSGDIPGMYYLPKPPNAPSLKELAGSWEDDRTAEEIVEDLRRSRT